jgi:hypothetical protein
METNGLIDSSASARAEFSGVMVIDSITAVAGKPKTVYLTGGFHTGVQIVMGAFKFFNGDNHHFEEGSRWFVHTTVS